MAETLTIRITDPQVRDVIVDALTAQLDLLEGQASVETAVGSREGAAATMRRWARTIAVKRMIMREG